MMARYFLPFLLIVAAYSATNNAHAAVTMTPSVEGLTGSTFKPMTAPQIVGPNFGGVGKVLINGRWVNIPGYIPPASTAASAAKSATWLNPWLTGLSLLAWVDDAGLGSDIVQGWVKTVPGVPDDESTAASCYIQYWGTAYASSAGAACAELHRNNTQYICPNRNTSTMTCWSTGSMVSPSQYSYTQDVLYWDSGSQTYVQGPVDTLYKTASTTGPAEDEGTSQPATLADFEALPDPPLPVLADLAPQVGVVVDSPVYEPVTVPVGDVYTKPDGSTAQPMAAISPASGGQVTVDTYDLPITDANGDPLNDPAPVDTPEETAPTPTQCDKYPQTLGCSLLDVPDSDSLGDEQRDIALIAPVSVGGAGSCPAPLTATVLGQVVEMSFDPLCQFANTLRPLVLSLAWLSAGFIFIGGVRNG